MTTYLMNTLVAVCLLAATEQAPEQPKIIPTTTTEQTTKVACTVDEEETKQPTLATGCADGKCPSEMIENLKKQKAQEKTAETTTPEATKAIA